MGLYYSASRQLTSELPLLQTGERDLYRARPGDWRPYRGRRRRPFKIAILERTRPHRGRHRGPRGGRRLQLPVLALVAVALVVTVAGAAWRWFVATRDRYHAARVGMPMLGRFELVLSAFVAVDVMAALYVLTSLGAVS